MRTAAALAVAVALLATGCGKDPARLLEEADAAREMGLEQKAAGRELEAKSLLHSALGRYLELREAAPDESANLDERIGDTYSALGDQKQALQFWDLALARTPERASLWHKRGTFLIATGQAEAGKAALERALALDPKLAQVHLHLGILAFQAKDIAPALVHLGKAAELAPDDPNVQKAYGVALVQSGQTGPGAVALHRAWSRDRDTIGAARLFELLFMSGRWAAALEVGEVAATESGDPLVLMRFGYAAIQAGQVERGRGVLNSLKNLDLPPDVRSQLDQLIAGLDSGGP